MTAVASTKFLPKNARKLVQEFAPPGHEVRPDATRVRRRRRRSRGEDNHAGDARRPSAWPEVARHLEGTGEGHRRPSSSCHGSPPQRPGQSAAGKVVRRRPAVLVLVGLRPSSIPAYSSEAPVDGLDCAALVASGGIRCLDSIAALMVRAAMQVSEAQGLPHRDGAGATFGRVWHDCGAVVRGWRQRERGVIVKVMQSISWRFQGLAGNQGKGG
jgi:hypothetical protein